MTQAARIYRQPLPVVRQAYVWGSKSVPPIGRIDVWGVWWAPAEDVARVFAPVVDPAATVRPVNVQRTLDRAARLEAAAREARR